MSDFLIETKQLTKIYGEQTAVNAVNLHVIRRWRFTVVRGCAVLWIKFWLKTPSFYATGSFPLLRPVCAICATLGCPPFSSYFGCLIVYSIS